MKPTSNPNLRVSGPFLVNVLKLFKIYRFVLLVENASKRIQVNEHVDDYVVLETVKWLCYFGAFEFYDLF
jgi:hypothetical protein